MATTAIARLTACFAIALAALPAAGRELDLTLPRSTTPIGFATPDRAGGDALPAGDYERNGLDTRHDGSGFDVSGSVTTGIGYTKGDGSSRFSSAHLRVAHDDDDDDDGRPSRFSLDIDVGTARGPGFVAPYGYGGYGGPYGDGDDRYDRYDDGYGGADAFRADGSRIEDNAPGVRRRR